LKVDSLQEVEKKLTELGAEFLEQQLHRDYYLDDANGILKEGDRCLRLRRQKVENRETVFLTYKGAKEKDNFKKRQEIEVEVKDIDSITKLFSALGYEKALAFEKRRQVWRFGECEVALDELPLLGSFVEIEGDSDEKISDVQMSLGLSDLPHIGESYALLMEEKLCELGKEQREVFFYKSLREQL
ncbi:MAG: class IV adenylate cyclase, partial [Planctomycetes bacterium]|nr:class IV adenylate cyclase [Planctomycetota bacterium]